MYDAGVPRNFGLSGPYQLPAPCFVTALFLLCFTVLLALLAVCFVAFLTVLAAFLPCVPPNFATVSACVYTIADQSRTCHVRRRMHGRSHPLRTSL